MNDSSRERAASQAGHVEQSNRSDGYTPGPPGSTHEGLPDGGRDDEAPGMGARTPAPISLATFPRYTEEQIAMLRESADGSIFLHEFRRGR